MDQTEAQCSWLTASLVPAEVPLLRVLTSTLQPGASSPPVPAGLFKLVQPSPSSLHYDTMCQSTCKSCVAVVFYGKKVVFTLLLDIFSEAVQQLFTL